MRSILKYFIDNPIAGNLLMFALLLAGVFGLYNMRSTYFPEVESRIISIQTILLGASPEEIEEGIINKIEENLKGVTGLEQITSVSSENSGNITVEILPNEDIDVKLQDVKNAVDQISSFPTAMEPPVVYKRETIGDAITFAVSGDVDLKTLKTFARRIEDDLLSMDGLSQVTLSGFPEEEIEITFREADLRAYQLNFTQAANAVRNENLEVSGGSIKGQDEELLIRSRNKGYYADDLLDIIVKTNPNGSVIRLHQIADVQDRWEDNPDRSYINGEPSVVIKVQNTIKEDMLGINEKVRNYIEGFNEKNDIVKATVILDRSILLNQRIDLLAENGIIGFGIVLLLLAMFLNWRLAFWVALSIPISFAGMFIVSYMLGITINVISLFGMILVIGILVDDGIVISENIYQQYEKGKPRMQAAIDGTMSVLPAVTAAILTTVVVFCTFFFIDGRLGDFFSEMAVVVIFSLVFSLVEGAFILPAHVAHSRALERGLQKNRVSQALDDFMNWMRRKLYAPVLRFAISNKLLTLAFITSCLLIFFGSFMGGFIRGTFFPIIDGDNLSINLNMPAGTREQSTQEWLDHIEKAAWEVNRKMSDDVFGEDEREVIVKVEKYIGPTPYQGKVNITLLDGETRDNLPSRQVSNAIRKAAGPIFGAESVTFGASNIFGSPLSISLTSENPVELKAATNEIKDLLKQESQLKDITDTDREGLREIDVQLNEKAKFLGLNLQEIISQVRQGFFGNEVQRLQRGRDEVRVWVRYDNDYRSNISNLEKMRVRLDDGREFPLNEIANLSIKRGVIAINHIDGKREVRVESDIADDDVSISDITARLRSESIPPILDKYPSVIADYEGQNREQEKSSSSIQKSLSVAMLIMFFIIAVTFRSISQTLVVFSLIPFGLIGVGLGHYLMGTPISLFSILGVLALIGILVNDSLVFVNALNDNIKEGMTYKEAVHEAGISRFRPILLTTVTTFAGLAPILFEKSLQAQFLIPMAISVAFGLLIVTAIILVLLPALLVLANEIKVYSLYVWEGEWFEGNAVESANSERVSNLGVWIIAGVLSVGAFIGIIVMMNNVLSNIY